MHDYTDKELVMAMMFVYGEDYKVTSDGDNILVTYDTGEVVTYDFAVMSDRVHELRKKDMQELSDYVYEEFQKKEQALVIRLVFFIYSIKQKKRPTSIKRSRSFFYL